MSPAHCPFRCRRCLCPVRDCFVRDGSAPPALAAVITNDWCFGRAMDDDDDGSPSHSVSNIDRITTSSSCLSSLLLSVIFVVVFLLPKCPSQSRRRTTSKKSRAYPPASTLVSSSSSVATPLPSSPSQSSRQMNNAPMLIACIDVVAVARLHHHRALAPLSRQSSEGGSYPPG